MLQANAYCERQIGTMRRELLDFVGTPENVPKCGQKVTTVKVRSTFFDRSSGLSSSMR